jgi:RNA polymerase II-associated factor 1
MSEFLCRLKYRNTLPEIPVAPKLLKYAFDNDRFVNYCTTTLEKNAVADLMPDIVKAVPIDLVDMKKWNLNDTAALAPEDEELLRGVDKIQGPRTPGHGRFHRPEVSWLRRTEYISADFFRKQERLSEKYLPLKKGRRSVELHPFPLLHQTCLHR